MILLRIITDLLTNRIVLKIPEGVKIFRFLCLFFLGVFIPTAKPVGYFFQKKLFRRTPQLDLWESILTEFYNHFNGFSNNLQKKDFLMNLIT